MEHINVKELAGGLVALSPEGGYRLLYVPTGATYSEAVVKKAKAAQFRAVPEIPAANE